MGNILVVRIACDGSEFHISEAIWTNINQSLGLTIAKQ